MKISDKMIDVLIEFEGLELEPYKCSAGVLTIGIGHVMRPNMDYSNMTKDKALELFRRDVDYFERGIRSLGQLTQHQFDALVAFSFNVGLGAFKSSTMLRFIRTGDMVGAAKQFLRWNRAAGKEVEGLTKRRLVEAIIFSGLKKISLSEINKIVDLPTGLRQTSIKEAIKILEGYHAKKS